MEGNSLTGVEEEELSPGLAGVRRMSAEVVTAASRRGTRSRPKLRGDRVGLRTDPRG